MPSVYITQAARVPLDQDCVTSTPCLFPKTVAMSVSLLLVASCATLSLLLYATQQATLYLRRCRIKRENGCLPPRRLPQTDPFFGTDVVLQNLREAKKYGFLRLLQTRHAEHGKTFTTNTYLRTTINTCDPVLIQNVLSLQFRDFGMGPLRRKSASPLLGRGIFTTDGDAWAHQRALIRPSFVRAQVSDFAIFGRHVDQLIALIARQDYKVDLQQLFFRMVLDSNSEYMFGESVGLMSETASDSATAFHNALDYAQQGTILRLRLGNLMFAHRDRKFRDSCRAVHAYAQRFVDRALQHNQRGKEDDAKYVFLHELARDTQDPVLLRDNIVNMLLAARDTTAGLLAFVFFMLTRRPDVWAKLRSDVLEHYCEPLTYEAVMEMTYLRYVLQESK